MMNILVSLSILLSILLTLRHVEPAPAGALVQKLPGFNGVFPSKHYSGYVRINGSPSKNLFYYFVESERSPSKDPLVLWLNGGPGCSSFDGFVYEHGPFNFEAGKSRGSLPVLHLNPFSWSKASNIIYLDSPAGVGFSYSWFKQFPEFLANSFYIAGESYAGVYVPTLSLNIAQGIKSGVKPIINFKGYMVGNGVTDRKFDGNALVPFVHGMGLIPDSIFQNAEATCKGNYYQPDSKCEIILDQIDSALIDLNIYNILEPCFHGSRSNIDADSNNNTITNSLPSSFKQLGATERPLAVRKRLFGRAWPFRAPVTDGLIPLWPQIMERISVPCIDDEVATTWLNNDAVRKAIHASPEAGQWSLCTGDLIYSHDAGSMINYHKNLTSQGYRALIFSGDHDMCVPFTGSEAWTASLGYKIVDAWRPWNSNGQVAGYTQGYANNLVFLTIKGAGHTVPEYKPKEALDFYGRWLQGKSI